MQKKKPMVSSKPRSYCQKMSKNLSHKSKYSAQKEKLKHRSMLVDDISDTEEGIGMAKIPLISSEPKTISRVVRKKFFEKESPQKSSYYKYLGKLHKVNL
jgi:hypoxanthine phosphoribosyltransferase